MRYRSISIGMVTLYVATSRIPTPSLHATPQKNEMSNRVQEYVLPGPLTYYIHPQHKNSICN